MIGHVCLTLYAIMRVYKQFISLLPTVMSIPTERFDTFRRAMHDEYTDGKTIYYHDRRFVRFPQYSMAPMV